MRNTVKHDQQADGPATGSVGKRACIWHTHACLYMRMCVYVCM